MRIPEEIIQEILRRVNIVDVVGRYVRLQRKGNRYWGLSPFKAEKTPSFSVSPEKGVYYCFSTQKGGGAINFIKEMEHLDFPDALAMLAEIAGVSHLLEDVKSNDNSNYNVLRDVLGRLAGSFGHLLVKHNEGEAARKYLASRNIGEESITTFQLGYVPQKANWVYNFLSKHKYTDTVIMQTGLFSDRKYCLFSGRLVFPIQSMQGNVIAFGGRIIDGDGPKYLNSKESMLFQKKQTLYGLFQALPTTRKEREVYVVEGYFDVIAMHQAGYKNTVAPLGTALSKEHMHLLKRYADRIIFVYDGDEAGSNAVIRSAMIAEESEISAAVVSLPAGSDPADIILSGQTGAIEALLDPENVFAFVLRYYMEHIDLSTKKEERVAQKIFEYIEIVPSLIVQQEYLTKLANMLNLDRHAVTQDFRRYREKNIRYVPENHSDSTENTHKMPKKTVDFVLAIVLFRRPELFISYRERIDYNDIEDANAQQLLLLLEDSYRQGEIGKEAWNIVHRIQDATLRNYVTESLVSEEFSNEEMVTEECFHRIQIRNYKKKQRRLEREIRRLEHNDATSNIERKELLAEKQHIDKKLNELSLIKDKR